MQDREKRRASWRAFEERHREKRQAKNRTYDATHRAERAAKAAARRKAHPAQYVAAYQAFQAAHRKELAVKRRLYRAAHPEICRERVRAWHSEHPDESRALNHIRRARKRGAAINNLSAAQWRELQAAFDHCCAYCGRRAKGHLTQDHITPLSQGGNHTLSNVVPACKTCNDHKHAGPPPSPVQPLLLSLAPAKKKRRK
jgi:5-methylcytosine-specific restriction endonuclease McrA